MFKTIHSSVNISLTEIILVSKETLTNGEYRKNNVWLWSEIFQSEFTKLMRCELRMNYTTPTQNAQNNS